MSYIFQDVVHFQAFVSVVLLVGFLIATTLLQSRASSQSEGHLGSLSERTQKTELYAIAEGYLKRRNVSLLDVFAGWDHATPVWFLIFVVLGCSVLSYFGAEFISASNFKSYVLGGAYAARTAAVDPALMQYQSGTVFVVTMAFFGAYIWTIRSLIQRINNYDMRPNTYYFLSVRILTACLVAVVARHILAVPDWSHLIPGNSAVTTDAAMGDVALNVGSPWVLALLGFGIGWKPSLFVSELWQIVADRLPRKIPEQRAPTAASLPQELPLSMLQGMADDKVERLMELDIDSCQKLATENPIIMWLRTTYNLDIVIDWVSQAQLCVLFDGDQLEQLRKIGIRDIFGYLSAIRDLDARKAVNAAIAIPIEILSNHITVITENPSFLKLSELREATLPIARPVQLQAQPTLTLVGG